MTTIPPKDSAEEQHSTHRAIKYGQMVFGAFLVLLGIGGLVLSIIGGILILIAAAFSFPQIRARFSDATGVSLSRWMVVGIVLVGLIGGTLAVPTPEDGSDAPNTAVKGDLTTAAVANDRTPESEVAGDSTTVTPTQTDSAPSATLTTTTAVTTTKTTTATPRPTPTPVQPAPDDESYAYDGSGQSATGTFYVSGGLTVFDISHKGDSNIIVWLLDSDGNREELLVNDIGDWNGRVAMYLDDGEYLLNINADGQWSADVTQPRYSSAEVSDLPVSASGEYSEYIGPVNVDSLTRISFEGEDDKHYAVWLLNHEGERVDLLFNDIGPFSGDTAFGGTGIAIIKVETNGEWKLTIEQG